MKPGALGVWIFLASASSAVCQTTSTAHTTGTCSPAIAGNNNQVSISCTGMSAAKANQMIALMNKILAERLDLSQVNSKLDEIHEELGSVDAALNPFARATPEEQANLKEADALIYACSNFAQDWSTQKLEQGSTHESGRPAARPGDDINQQKSEVFRQQYAPRLAALNNRLHAVMPSAPANPDFSHPSSAMEASSFGRQVYSLARQYQMQQQQAGRPFDTALVNAAQKAWTDCIAFSQEWNHVVMAELNSSAPSRRPAPDQPADDEVAKYHSTLEPRLAAFRDKVGPQVPEFSSGRDYNAVETPMQLNSVCSDVLAIRNAYRQKVAGEGAKARGGK